MYSIPSQKTKEYYTIKEFKGVDFTTSQIDVDVRRSSNAKNFINNDGYNEKRYGYDILATIGTKINGVWNIDTDKGDLFLVHSGKSLYQCTSDFKTSTLVLTGMSDSKSKGIYLHGYLVIFDGTRVVVFSKFDGTNYEAKFADECGYIPTTSIARDNAGGGTKYEDKNLFSPYVKNTFISAKIETGLDDEGNPIYVNQTTFKLDEHNIDEITLVRKLNSEGDWEKVTDYTFDLTKGEVYFTPGEPPVLGRDNVEITYKKKISDNAKKINQCTIAELYGYEGNGNRIFVTGNKNFPNYDFWCKDEEPLYWPDNNLARVGTEPIVGYARLNDGTLAILKKQSDTDCTIYYRNYNLLNSDEVFPLQDGVKNIGCISGETVNNLLNDPLMLTPQGVYAVIGNNGEKFAMQRSYYVNGKLLKEPNLDDAISIVVDGKYYLGINNHVYIADSRYLSYPKHAKTEQYQYEWWYWENIPARVFFSWNNKLYFGTNDGKICTFGTTYKDGNQKNVECYWETPFLDFDTNDYAKTIKTVTLVLNPKQESDITLSYELDDGTSEIINKEYSNLSDTFPKTIREKERIKKFMFVKFIMESKTNKRSSFERLSLEYVFAGKYKGE